MHFYENEGVQGTGKCLIGKLISAIERLAIYPKNRRIVPEFNLENLREIIHSSFRIVHRYDKKKLRVVHIWCSERILKIP